MLKSRTTIYKTCRLHAGLTRETAAEKLHLGVRTLAAYEGGETRVPRGMVAAMADAYNSRELLWHDMKEDPVYGRYAQDTTMPSDSESAAFRLIQAYEDMGSVAARITSIVSDGKIKDDELANYDSAINVVRSVCARLLSVVVYAGKPA